MQGASPDTATKSVLLLAEQAVLVGGRLTVSVSANGTDTAALKAALQDAARVRAFAALPPHSNLIFPGSYFGFGHFNGIASSASSRMRATARSLSHL